MPHNKLTLISLLKEAIAVIENLPIEKSCNTCLNYNHPHCILVNAIPPAEIFKSGCERYHLDENSPPF